MDKIFSIKTKLNVFDHIRSSSELTSIYDFEITKKAVHEDRLKNKTLKN